MPERDAEGRPVATHNAGAFLAPVGGVVPAPSSMLDEGGEPSQPRVDPQLRGRLRSIAAATSVAIWALLSAGFRYLLAATESTAEVRPVALGYEMTRLMHTDASWYLANAVFMALGIVLVMRRSPLRSRADWLWIGGASVVVAVLLGLVISVVAGFSAAILALVAAIWLAVVLLARR